MCACVWIVLREYLENLDVTINHYRNLFQLKLFILLCRILHYVTFIWGKRATIVDGSLGTVWCLLSRESFW